MKFTIKPSNALNESVDGDTIKDVRGYYADKRVQVIQDFKQLEQILAKVDSIVNSPSFAPGVEFGRGTTWVKISKPHGFTLSKMGNTMDNIVFSRKFKKTTVGHFKQNVEPLLKEVYTQFKSMDDHVMVHHDLSELYIIIGNLPAIDKQVNRGGI